MNLTRRIELPRPMEVFNAPPFEETFSVAFALESVDEKGTFKGIASVFGNLVDSYPPTIIEKGAFTKTLQDRAGRIKVLWQHDPRCPIGVPTKMIETDVGLEVEGRISDTMHGADCIKLMRDKVITELSIGFDPIKFEYEDVGTPEDPSMIRHVKELRLWEISPVTWGADSKAKITTVHNAVNKVLGQLAQIEGLSYDATKGLYLIDAFAGKMPKKHADLIRMCIKSLEAILQAAEPPAAEQEETSGTGTETTAPIDRLSMLRDAELAYAQLEHLMT